jgi:hypothetical protein
MNLNRLLTTILLILFATTSRSLHAISIFAVSTDGNAKELLDTRDRFILEHLTDGTSSPWCIAAEDFDKNSRLEIEFQDKEDISEIYIASGFYDSKLYKMNSHPTKMILEVDDKSTREINLKETHLIQKYSFPKISTQTISIRFPDISKGSKYQDLCISEISFKKLNDADLIKSKKDRDTRINNMIQSKILFQSVQGEEVDSFTIQKQGKDYIILPNPENNKSIVVYQPYDTYSLQLNPLPKIQLATVKSDYDLYSFSIQGNCSKGLKDKKSDFPCTIHYNPYLKSYQIYDKKKLIFLSRNPEMFQ